MRCLRVVPCAVLAALLVGCGDEPLTPTDNMLTPAFNEGGTDRPFTASLTAIIDWEYDWADPDCPALMVSDGRGTVTHLGNVHHHSTHCSPVTKPTYEDGHWMITAANGDELILEYGGWPSPLIPALPVPIEVVGGTGRFANAFGTIYLVEIELIGEWGGGLPITPWYGSYRLEGTISY